MRTLLNFEEHFRPAKISKAREMYLKGQIVELKKAKIVWVAKSKIGRYTIHIHLTELTIGRSSCNCEDRPRSGFCNHSVAMLFAIRKELNLFPGLTNAQYQLPCTDSSLTDLLDLLRDPEFEITKKYLALFTSTSHKMLKDAESFINKKNYASAGGTCFYVIASILSMKENMNVDYFEGDDCINNTFDLLEKIWQTPMAAEHRDQFAHDARLAAIRSFKSDKQVHEKWMNILLLSADDENRKQKMKTITDRFRELNGNYLRAV